MVKEEINGNPHTAVIIVNYNNLADTIECLRTLKNSNSSVNIVVVDNGSTGNDAKRLGQIEGIILIENKENLGFGRGNNVGIRWALSNTDCEFIFLLNNDATVESDTISKLEKALYAFPEAGVSCPRIVMMEEPDVLWYGGGEVNWFKGSVIAPDYLGPADAKQALIARNVTFASGCAMLIRRSVFEKVGGFDPRLFIYVEDLEFCLRVNKAGWTIRYIPEAVVKHKCQGSKRGRRKEFFPIDHPANPNLSFFMYHLTKNRLLTIFIHAKGLNALKFYLFFPIYLSAKCIQYAFHKQGAAIKAIGKGIWDFLRIRKEPFGNEITTERS
ncbi:MAG: glycosyltransferase family 2 protein, partial [Thermotogota bacterium]|nr:glycosyltransferase family 2 protein [Thermotogota bacterium]